MTIRTFLNHHRKTVLAASVLAACMIGPVHAQLPLNSLDNIAVFNGNTGTISACIGLFDADNQPILNGDNQAETYDVQLQLFVDDASPEDIKFQLTSAVPTANLECSGHFQEGVYTDNVLIANAQPPLDGTVYSMHFDHDVEAGLVFTLNLQPELLQEVRSLQANSIELGTELGSFGNSLTLSFNTVNLPATYALTAPQCSDPDGDSTQVIIERDNVQIATITPGTSFTIQTQNLSEGSHTVRAYCSDEAALDSTVLGTSYGTNSDYAVGNIELQVNIDPSCTQTISTLAQNLHVDFPNNIPTWEQLNCFVAPLTRQTVPEFFLFAGDTPPPAGDEPTAPENPLTFWETVQLDLAFIQQWPEVDFYGPTQVQIPPFLIGADDRFTQTEWDQKLRGIGTYALLNKSLGHLTKVDYFTPPSSNIDITHSSEEFLTWWNTQYIPERVQLAQLAEIVKAEYYQPWDIEPGQFVRPYGDLWLDNLSDEEQIALGQQIIDSLYNAVRPEFSGTLMLINYDRFAAAGDHWKQLDLSAWDLVSFALFTEGDVEGTQLYLDEQLSGYAEMVARDGISNWTLQEITVNPERHQRLLDQQDGNVQFEDIEADIYQAVFDTIEQYPGFKGLGFTVGNIVTPEAEALVRAKYESLSEAQ